MGGSLDAWQWLRTPAARQPLALFIDFDGTLVAFARRPDEIVVSRGLISLLVDLDHVLDHAVAIVSGRPLAQIDYWLRPFSAAGAGLHGAEIRSASGAAVQAQALPTLPPEVGRRISMILQQLANPEHYLLEEKGAGLALHYPAQADTASVEAALRDCLCGHQGWQLIQGRRVFEIRHATATKGRAVQALAQSQIFTRRRPVCLGDDVTDLDMFDAVRAAGGIAISVGSRIRQYGNFSLGGPGEARTWLQHLLGAQRGMKNA